MLMGIYSDQDTEKKDLYNKVINDLSDSSSWRKRDKEIVQRRMCMRPVQKTRPYVGAPNFMESIIQDVVQEKTDQEISMKYNAPHVCHAAPLIDVPPELRIALEQAFDSYIRYVIKSRAKDDELLDCKNARGFGIAKQVRVYNSLLKKEIPDFVVKDIRSVIVPEDTEYENAYRITDVLRMTANDLRSRAKDRGWRNVDYIIANARADTDKRDAGGSAGADSEDTHEITKTIVGLSTSRNCNYYVIWEVYHLAEEDDVEDMKAEWDEEIEIGDRMVSIICPDCQGYYLMRYAWREEDVQEELSPEEWIMEQAMAAMEERPAVTYRTIKGEERSWPFVQFRFENRSKDWYDSRGIGHLCMDEQIAATQIRNMQAVLIEYYQNPMLKSSPGAVTNSANVTFEPGSSLPQGWDWAQPPQVSVQMDLMINYFRSMAGRRGGAASMYNYSTNVGERKLQKSATESSIEESRASQISSASVDRFNEPGAKLYQLIYEDMARMKLAFPIVVPGQPSATFDTRMYAVPLMWIPAASAKTLSPDAQLGKSIAASEWAKGLEGKVPWDWVQVAKTVLSNYDTRMTSGWIANGEAKNLIDQRLAQLEQDMKSVAQGGKELSDRLQNTEQFVVKVADENESLKKALMGAAA